MVQAKYMGFNRAEFDAAVECLHTIGLKANRTAHDIYVDILGHVNGLMDRGALISGHPIYMHSLIVTPWKRGPRWCFEISVQATEILPLLKEQKARYERLRASSKEQAARFNKMLISRGHKIDDLLPPEVTD